MTVIEAALARGSCPIQVFGDIGARSEPVVLLFMDGFGPRPVLDALGARLSAEGYRVLLPHLFYDQLPYAPLKPAAVFSGDVSERERLMGLFQSIDQSKIDADIAALMQFIEERCGTEAPIGATGYCMGGRYALTAASASKRVGFAASFHGSNLALERDDSPHRRFAGVAARIYIGVAGIDPTFPGAEESRLAGALREHAVDHVIETYAGANHGFVMSDLPVYDAAAAERHWQRLTHHMRECFARA